MSLPSSRAYAGWLALLRILTGGIWLVHAVPKFLNSAAFMPPDGAFAVYLQNGVGKTAGPYHDFLVNVVQPNANTFAELVRFGETAVGISLLLGLFSRLGGLFGVVLTLDYIAARGGLGSFTAWSSMDGSLMLLSATSLVLPTGKFLGLDALLFARSRPRRVVAEVVPERPMDGPTAPRA
jgi:uncharacterized membrane protein YphA (DoxX/SURF4 family)